MALQVEECVLVQFTVDFIQNFAQFTIWYCPKPFISGAIEGKVTKGALVRVRNFGY